MDWKQDITICSVQKTHFSSKDTEAYSEGLKDVFQASGNQKKAGIAMLRSVKIDFKPKMVKENCIMIKQ